MRAEGIKTSVPQLIRPQQLYRFSQRQPDATQDNNEAESQAASEA
jgi:hypothetical protein